MINIINGWVPSSQTHLPKLRDLWPKPQELQVAQAYLLLITYGAVGSNRSSNQPVLGVVQHSIKLYSLLSSSNHNVTIVVVELCSFFWQLCVKTLSQSDLDKLESCMIQTLCHLEMLFPPTFFYNHGSFNMSSGWWGKTMRSCTLSLDVSHWKVNIFVTLCNFLKCLVWLA